MGEWATEMQSLLAIPVLLLCLVSCLGYGWAVLALLRRQPERDPLQAVYALALGMGTLAYLVLFAGLAGALHPPVLVGLVVAGWVPAVLYLRARRGSTPVENGSPGDVDEPRFERWITLLLVGYLGLLVLMSLLSALKPVDGLDWDSLSYHLAAPKIYLREGRIPFIAYDSHTQFPFTMEMLYTLGLWAAGPAGAKLFHWTAGWLTALALGLWTARLPYRGERLPFWAGPLAAAFFASMPLVLWEMGTAYVDLGTSLFQFLALAALADSIRMREEVPEVDPRGTALAGILSGFALGTKMTALLQFGLLGLALFWVLARVEDRKRALQALLLFGGLGVLVGSPWYVKSWLWTHNPVYPFFFRFFPHSYSWTEEMTRGYEAEQKAFGLGRSPMEFALAPWNLGMHGRAFYINFRSLAGDKIGSLGPVWAGLLPLLLWVRRPGWRVGGFCLYFFLSLGAWFLLSQQSRYLVPIFAPLAAVLALVVAALPTWPLRAAAGAFAAGALFLNLGMHAPLAMDALNVVSGAVSPREYLRASLGPLQEASEFVNTLPPGSRVALYQETRGFYFDRPYFWANPGQHNLIPYADLADGGALADALKRFGITHVLINFDFAQGVEAHHWYQVLMDAVRTGRLREVFRTRDAELGRRGIVVFELR